MRRASPGLWLAAAAVLAFLGACREVQEALVWSPDTAALVDGRPITMDELNQVLGWGFYGQLSQDEGAAAAAPEAVRLLVLEKMIEERLVLAEAARRKISLEAVEKEIKAARLDESWSRPDLPPDQAENLRQNLLRQLVLHKTTAGIMDDGRRLSAADWQSFWQAWPKKKPTLYLVRVLLLPLSPEAPALPEPGRENFDQMAQRFKLEGFPAVLSEAVWFRSDRLDRGLRAVLEAAWAGRKPSQPVRQEGSWAIYEVLDLDREAAAVDDLRAARAVYELKAGEEAFRGWLEARRAAADIRINPSLIQSRE
jgi:hypothetical protein